MERIIIFEGISRYNVLNTFARQLSNSLRKYYDVKIINLADEDFQRKLQNQLNQGVNVTIGFNGMSVPILYEEYNVPHLALLVDHPIYHISELNLESKNLFVGNVDYQRYRFMKEEMKFNNSFIFYHAVNKNIKPQYDKKNYDIVMLGGIADSNKMRGDLINKYDKVTFGIIEDVAECASNNSLFTIEELFDKVVEYKNIAFNYKDKIDLYKVIIPDIERYVRSISREKSLEMFSKYSIDLFGDCNSNCIKSYPNIRIHNPVSYEDTIKIIKKSKISLNSTKTILSGSHERTFLAGMCGSVNLTNKTDFYKDVFQEDAVYYNDTSMIASKDAVEVVLNDDNKRKEMAEKAYNKIFKEHTWDNRAEQIKNMLS